MLEKSFQKNNLMWNKVVKIKNYYMWVCDVIFPFTTLKILALLFN